MSFQRKPFPPPLKARIGRRSEQFSYYSFRIQEPDVTVFLAYLDLRINTDRPTVFNAGADVCQVF